MAEDGDRSPKTTGTKKKNVVEHIARSASEVNFHEPGKGGKKKKKPSEK